MNDPQTIQSDRNKHNTVDKRFFQLYNWLRKLKHSVPKEAWHILSHTAQNVFGGFSIGISLHILQFTWDKKVNALMLNAQQHFIRHYQDIPFDLFSVAILLGSASLALVPMLGAPLRRYFIAPIFNATSHATGLTSGMMLSLAAIEISERSFSTQDVSHFFIVLMVVFMALAFSLAAHFTVHNGPGNLLAPREEAFVPHVPKEQSTSPIVRALIVVCALVMVNASWRHLKENSIEFDKKHVDAQSKAPNSGH